MYLAIMICFTSYTALEFWSWLIRTESQLERPHATQWSLMSRTCSSASDIRIACQHFHDQAYPIHVLVPESSGRKGAKNIVFHRISSEPPRGALFKLANDLIVVSPEYAFIQCCLSSSRPTAIRLASELCSSFVYDENDMRGFMKCKPLMSLNALVSIVRAADGIRGAKEARNLTRYIVPNAASPREVAVALLLSLPMRLGGYGLEKPELNKRLSLPANVRSNNGQPYITADMLWPEMKIALEYDSDAYHSERTQIANDSRRRKILEDIGLSVISLTNEELKNTADLQHVAERIAMACGKRFRITIQDFHERNRRLRSELLSQSGDYRHFPTKSSFSGKF